MARRRGFSIISMSFLDAMTCGFGAIILFFMIIAANVDLRRENTLKDRSAEVNRLELQVDVGKKNLVELRQALASLAKSMAETQAARDQIVTEIDKTKDELKKLLEDSDANKETIEKLKADLAKLESDKEDLAAKADTSEETGNFIREIRGEGYRQYLTGLRMGGQRVLILVDTSASMLDRTVLGVLTSRRKSDAEKLNMPKWRQVVDSVDWITAQIEPGTFFQVIAFNSEAHSVIDGSDGQWVEATDGSELTKAVEALRKTVPDGGTSLHAAFEAMNSLVPPPDNVFLLVDGLPTMGETAPRKQGVTGRERLQHFNRATREVSRRIPINVLLYALEGDPQAAPAYWTLAYGTGGSMMAPSEDWP